MEQSNPTEIRTLLREVFNKFDKDKNGYIDIGEANLIFKELGQEVSTNEIKDFFNSIDENHDGKLSFEELFTWFTSSRGKEAALGEALKFKMVYMMEKAKKALLKYSSSGSELETFHLEVNAGKKVLDPKSLIEINVVTGSEAEEKFNSIANGLTVSKDLSIVFEIKSTAPQEALTSILELLEQVKEFAKQFVPPQFGVDDFKFSGAVEGDTVKIGIDYDGFLSDVVKAQVQAVLSSAIPEGTPASLSFGFYFANQLKGGNTTLVTALNDGISLSIDAKLPSSFMEALRNKWLQPDAIEHYPQELKSLLFLFALKKVNVEIDFMPLGSLIQKLIPELSELTVGTLAEQGEKQGASQMVSQLPLVPELLSLGFSKLVADFKLNVKLPNALTSLHFKLEGVGEALNFLQQ